MMPIRLVAADDHPIVLAGMAEYFSLEPDIEIVAQVRNGIEALDAVFRLQPDVLVLDLRMPRMDGLTVLREMNRHGTSTKVVVLTALDNDEVVEAVVLGARGVVMKDAAASDLVRCVREVAAGQKWLQNGVATRTVERLLERRAGHRTSTDLLTRREAEVACMVAQGLPSKAIARKLSITEGTAKLHLHHIYEKLGLNGRIALLQYIQQHGTC